MVPRRGLGKEQKKPSKINCEATRFKATCVSPLWCKVEMDGVHSVAPSLFSDDRCLHLTNARYLRVLETRRKIFQPGLKRIPSLPTSQS